MLSTHPPLRTGHGAPGLPICGSRSTSSSLSADLDSEEPFCRSGIVRMTNKAICKNSLSQFSNVAWIKCPVEEYDPNVTADLPSSLRSWLYCFHPVTNWPNNETRKRKT